MTEVKVCQVSTSDLCAKLNTPRSARNAHAYTPVIRQEIRGWNVPVGSMKEREFKGIIEDWRKKVHNQNCRGCLAALANISSKFVKDKEVDEKGKVREMPRGKIADPELGEFNICFPMKVVVEKCDSGVLSETLHEIGTTCIQGISHRVLYIYKSLL